MNNLLIELFVEELPPRALKKLGESFAGELHNQLRQQGLLTTTSTRTSFASPRRLAVHITDVAPQAADKPVSQKLMPVSVGLDAQGQATPALTKKLQSLGVSPDALAATVAGLKRAPDGKAEALFFESTLQGVTLTDGVQKALNESLSRLPIPKVMQYQLHAGCDMPGWSSVSFVRPAHGLVALYGAEVLPVQVLGLQAGRQTQGHRFEAAVSPITLDHADSYAQTLTRDGAVMASFEQRREEIVRQLQAAAQSLGEGLHPIDDEALLDEVTALVERPKVLVCEFDKQFLDVPQECLILTMKANQKYFPLLDAQGRLTHRFLVVSNINPADPSAVIGGNERVVRPRLADAKFFFDQDRKRSLIARVPGLSKVVYHNQLGTQGERMERVRAIAQAIVSLLSTAQDGADLAAKVDTAAHLAKADLLTDMVGEFPELQGIMGGYCARHDGLGEEVAQAIEDHYKPRFSGDTLPRNRVGVVVALADKLETLVGMFGIGNLPSGDKDPYALRRHALGVIRMLIEQDLPLDVRALIEAASPAFADKIKPVTESLLDFLFDRLAGNLREQGYSAQEVDAVLALRPSQLGDVAKRLAAVRSFTALPEAPVLAAANKRVGNILKKSDVPVSAAINPALLHEAAEIALAQALTQTGQRADAAWAQGDYAANLAALATLKTPVDAFFESVMVNAEDPALKANRLGLLASLHGAMNRVADLSRLA